MRSAIVLIAVFAVCLGSPRRPVPHHPNAELIDGALQRIGDSRIINGDNAEIENFPWQASLKVNGGHSCGASIISEYWLVTAAHCTQGSIGSYTVGFGNKYVYGQNERAVARIINHEYYGQGSGAIPNDISLIQLSSPLTFGDQIGKIELADETIDDSSVPCTISGWGRTGTGGSGATAYILQAADTTIKPRSACMVSWGSNINPGHVCVGGDSDEGACNGDSGGPLVCTVNGERRLVGATSWGLNGCYTYRPSVYTNIPYFREWIKKNSGI